MIEVIRFRITSVGWRGHSSDNDVGINHCYFLSTPITTMQKQKGDSKAEKVGAGQGRHRGQTVLAHKCANFCPAAAFLPPCSSHATMACLHQFSRQREGMPMNSKPSLAISEFSKGRWAAEPSDEPPLHPTELNLVTKVLSWLGKLSPLALPLLIAFSGTVVLF